MSLCHFGVNRTEKRLTMQKNKTPIGYKTLNRRNFLQLSSVLALETMLFGSSLQASSLSSSAFHLVIIGGGIGGATAAKYMRLLNSEVKITVIEPNKEYMFCPGSNEILPGWATLKEQTVTYTTLKNRYKVNFIHTKAKHINYVKKQVSLENDTVLSYDKLIVSPGVSFDYGAIEGYSRELAETTFPSAWKLDAQTLLLKKQILSLPKGGRVIISVPKSPYRCPPAPYERATFIVHMLKESNPSAKVTILDANDDFVFDNVYPYYWEKHFNFGKKNASLERVAAKEGGTIVKLNAAKKVLINSEGKEFKGDVLNIIAPEKAAKFAFDNDLTEGDWCPVNYKDFSSTKHKDVYVIGDAIISDPMPKTGYVAANQARVVVQAINDELHGKPVGTPFIVNDCIAMVEQGYGMTLSEIFRYDGEHKPLKARHYIPGVDKQKFQQKMLGSLAEDWQKTFRQSIFS